MDRIDKINDLRRWQGKDELSKLDLDLPLNTFGDSDAPDEIVTPDKEDRDEPAYPANWQTIATNLKTERNWRCELCSFEKFGSGLIQVHHIDHDKSNNHRSNLQVLCAVCHGKKHRTPPMWPRGVLDFERDELLSHHRTRDRSRFK